MLVTKTSGVWLGCISISIRLVVSSHKNLKTRRYLIRVVQSFWHLTKVSAAAMPRHSSNFKAIRLFSHLIPQLRGFTRSYYNMWHAILEWTAMCETVRKMWDVDHISLTYRPVAPHRYDIWHIYLLTYWAQNKMTVVLRITFKCIFVKRKNVSFQFSFNPDWFR